MKPATTQYPCIGTNHLPLRPARYHRRTMLNLAPPSPLPLLPRSAALPSLPAPPAVLALAAAPALLTLAAAPALLALACSKGVSEALAKAAARGRQPEGDAAA